MLVRALGNLAVMCGAFSLVAGCSTPPTDVQSVTYGPVRVYSGSYVPGWEFSDFTPVRSTETWWLSGNLKPIYPYEEGYHPHGVHLFITVEGQVSSPGHYGHLGRFPRELRVTRVISIRLHKASNQSLEPTAGRRDTHFDFMKQFLLFATLAAASGGSAPSR